ncbi:MAG: STAS domain-containing protein [Polaromonas sp.]|nr:STAS domain-containing protein [Polaromonas sp.]
MSQDDIKSGLLSKLVKFVRNPGSSWSDGDAAQAGKDDLVNKQLLKEMMERKRRNDFVRKREFDMLRVIRQREAAEGRGKEPDAGRPSFFQSSMLSPDDRASTLKKIDEIEAQMSMQWWKKEPGAASSTVNPAAMKRNSESPALTRPPPAPARPAPPPTRPIPQAPVRAMPSVKSPAFQTTLPSPLVLAARRAAALVPDPVAKRPAEKLAKSPATRDLSGQGGEAPSSGMSGLTPFMPVASSALQAVAQEMAGHDAELEEAAILFANGDDAGAEAGLLALLEPGAPRINHIDTWLTLFDLYRATGEQEKFEAAALKFLKRFDRSAPQWFCLPDMMKAMSNPKEKAAHGTSTDWICPSVVGLQTIAALNAAMARTAMPWRLDWKNLKTIDPSAMEPLLKVFSGWVVQPVQLQFQGAGQLQQVLLAATPSGEREVDQNWWQLRLQMLRIMNQPDDFELAALDFCVSYEVSPPAWERARCTCTVINADGNAEERQPIVGEAVPSNLPSMIMGDDSLLGPQSSQMSQPLLSVELSGHIQGDAVGVLDKLETRVAGASMVQISCTLLIRVDFSAAGMLLNWVSASQAEHRQVKFSEVNRLVAAFFNVIGITEYARVIVRVD